MRDLEGCLGVGTCCGKCKPAAKQILSETRAGPRLKLSGAPA
jgi:bacterioferritin-associated ferredoxin